MKSVEAIKSAKKGQGGIVTVGSVLVFPDEREGGNDGNGEDVALKQLKFQELKAGRKYMVSLFTESNSGSTSPVLVAEAETHAEAPMVRQSGFLVTSECHRSISYRTTHFCRSIAVAVAGASPIAVYPDNRGHNTGEGDGIVYQWANISTLVSMA